MNFKRGIEPKKSLNIGLHKRYPMTGDKFFVRFRLKLSSPEFYPLQHQEREGQFQIATVLTPISRSSDNSTKSNLVLCSIDALDDIKGLVDNPPFYARWNWAEECWAIE